MRILYEVPPNVSSTSLVKVMLGQTVQFHTLDSLIIGLARLAAIREGKKPFKLVRRATFPDRSYKV